MYEVEWSGPPPPSSKGDGKSKYLPFAENLMKRPTEWGRLAFANSSSAGSVGRNLRLGKIADGKWEAATRKVGDQHYLYARYVGPQ